ncbi:MAG: cupredoxin domain-containing protein [Gammaproteobacteria bacterium]
MHAAIDHPLIRRLLILAVILGGTALGARAATAGGTVVVVDMADFAFALSPSSVPAGVVIFRVKNLGNTQHDFELVGKNKTEVLAAGEGGELRATLSPGTYEYRCTVPGHAEAGMKGVLTVR